MQRKYNWCNLQNNIHHQPSHASRSICWQFDKNDAFFRWWVGRRIGLEMHNISPQQQPNSDPTLPLNPRQNPIKRPLPTQKILPNRTAHNSPPLVLRSPLQLKTPLMTSYLKYTISTIINTIIDSYDRLTWQIKTGEQPTQRWTEVPQAETLVYRYGTVGCQGKRGPVEKNQ